RIDAKFPEITVPNLIFDPPPIAAVVIGGRLYVRIFDRVIVVLVAIPKPISQRIIHDGVLPMKCRRFAQRTAYDIARPARSVRLAQRIAFVGRPLVIHNKLIAITPRLERDGNMKNAISVNLEGRNLLAPSVKGTTK